MALGITHGGWCPRGRRSEDGRIDLRYELKETESRDYAERTERNVIESDGTLILFQNRLSGGSHLTWKLALRHGRPVLKIDLQNSEPRLIVPAVQDWLERNAIGILNVAGPRESSHPGIGGRAREFLESLLQSIDH